MIYETKQTTIIMQYLYHISEYFNKISKKGGIKGMMHIGIQFVVTVLLLFIMLVMQTHLVSISLIRLSIEG